MNYSASGLPHNFYTQQQQEPESMPRPYDRSHPQPFAPYYYPSPATIAISYSRSLTFTTGTASSLDPDCNQYYRESDYSSQHLQFAGTIGAAAEQHLPPIRGRGTFLGGHPVHWTPTTPHLPTRATQGRGFGQRRTNRGRGRRPAKSASANNHNQASASLTEPMPQLSQTPGKAEAAHPMRPVAWCDVCRIECNSLKILEQHQNGKRHKRILKNILDIKSAYLGDDALAVPHLSSGPTGPTDLHVDDTLMNGGRPNDPEEKSMKKPEKVLELMGTGGGEKGRKKRAREQPRLCTLCNAMCDTLAVFEVHLAGKKHASKVRRFKGEDAVFTPISSSIPLPTSPPANAHPCDRTTEMLQPEAMSSPTNVTLAPATAGSTCCDPP